MGAIVRQKLLSLPGATGRDPEQEGLRRPQRLDLGLPVLDRALRRLVGRVTWGGRLLHKQRGRFVFGRHRRRRCQTRVPPSIGETKKEELKHHDDTPLMNSKWLPNTLGGF